MIKNYTHLCCIISYLFLMACSSTEQKETDGPRERMLQDIEMMKDPALGYVPTERLLLAKEYKERLMKSRAAIAGVNWTELGPKNQAGRTRTMLIDANDVSGNTVWAASVGGGLWKTTDITAAEPNWVIADNFFSNLAVTSIAQDPTDPDIIYFCTGEGYNNADAIRGQGVWKTIDGGATWNQLAATTGASYYYCQKILVNTTGSLFVATQSGLFRSTNGGTTFTKVLGTGLGITGATSNNCRDIEVAANGDIYSSIDGSIHKSGNDGVTFAAAMTLPVSANRIEIACAPNDANYAYLLIENGGAVNGIIRTINAGTSWVLRTEPDDADGGIPAADFSRGQAWYDLSIAVDPNNKDVLYVGGVDLFKSTDGAGSWTQVGHWYGGFGFPYVHADQHFIQYHPGSSSIIYFCNDGGIFRTANGNTSTPTMSDKGTNYVTAQFYGCAIHPTAMTAYYLAGSQDNGSHQFNSNNLQNTIQVTGGDGAFCNIDQNQPQYQWTQYVYNEYYRSTNGGGTWTNIASSGGRFINPTDYDDVNNRMYAARNTDQYSRWDNPQTGSTFVTVAAAAFGGQVSAVKVSPNTSNRVFFGIGTGDVFRVDNAHTGAPTFTDISTGLPGGYAVCVEVETGNDNHLLVTYSNFGVNSIWESVNGGTSWTSVEGNLPDMPVRWAVFNPNDNDQAVIATELGVWSTDNLNGGATVWGASNSGLANVRVDQLQYRTSDKLMIASTHGRGLFLSDAFADPAALFSADKVVSYIGANIQFTDNSFAASSWLWDFGDGNNSALKNPAHAYTASGQYDVTLTINGGASTLTKSLYIHILPNKGTPYTPVNGGDFETNANDFGADNTAGTPWQRGACVIAGKSGNFSPTNTWVTGLAAATYLDNSDASLMTPNYNFTLPGTYTVLFYKKNVFELGFDGFRLEYTLDKGTTWTPIGAVGPQWYDYANGGAGAAFPTGEPFFNSTSAAFVQRSLDVSSLAGNPNVAFRLRFKSDVNTNAAGVAIDNFEIQSSVINNPLPVNLQAFTVHENNNIGYLNWLTRNEKNFSHFEIERSVDGIHYSRITDIAAKKGVENEYRYADHLSSLPVIPNIIFYRLKMVDEDLKYSYSQVEKIILKSTAFECELAPNPFINQFSIYTNEPVTNISILNISGLEILKIKNVNNQITVPAHLPKGIYLVRLEVSGNKVYYRKVMKD